MSSKLRESHHFCKVSVKTTSFDVSSSWDFNSVGFSIFLETKDVTDIIEYSFSGKNDEVHGEINPDFFKGIFFDNKICSKIFFRRKSSGSPVVVRVEAWR